MTRKKIIIMALILILVATFSIGWSAVRAKMYDFNLTEASELTENHSYEMMTPTKVPFKEMKVTDLNVAEDKQTAVISLINADKNMLDIQITKTKPEYPADKKETVKIGNNISGEFIPDDTGRRILTWQKDELYYEIIYYYKLTPSEVSETQLIKMAASFN
ncbi:hypothetical protein F9U64_20990 [Gracilibacillus oryzae]|uniref:DUF4367 domain-containing protein n=1 Tax=Gracilibacillus oryzae TaxID=1672701 RepID=A0A7C8KMC5_9BACI|nr:hypothetical protein [Gracilibacillus oryzae]KAB8126011.1 hypothetical protein F9U64_20990 [Gracilibacillus oryzae]